MSFNFNTYVVLLHSPMVDRSGREVTTAVTNLDIHDIARSCRTFGIKRYYIVNPEPEQKKLVQTILGHWKTEVSQVYHPLRAQALEGVAFKETFEEAFNDVSVECQGQRPFVTMPDARELAQLTDQEKIAAPWGYQELRAKLAQNDLPGPLMIVFGTGWGIAPGFFKHVDRTLAPIRAQGDGQGISPSNRYNHLSVRSAVAIVLDRLFGDC